MVAGEVLHGQVGPLAAHGIEEHGGAEGSIRPCVLVVDGEERGEAVGEVLLQAGEREVQLVDDSVTQLVAEDELVTPHVQDVSCEVLLRDDLGRTLVADDLGEEFGEDVVGLLREGRRPEDPTTVQLGRRVVDALGHVVGVTTTWRSWGSATAFVRQSAIRSNTPESMIFFIASRFSGRMVSSW